MTIHRYFPISVAVFALVCGTVHYLGAPVLPFAVILLIGETLIGFQLEDHKVPDMLKKIRQALKTDYDSHLHPRH